MLYWSVVFLVTAIIAGILGFGGIASTSSSIAQVLFVIFVLGLILSAVFHIAKLIDRKSKF